MTRNEARGNLIHAIRWNDIPKKEALEMAIKALDQEACEDAVCRREALLAISNLYPCAPRVNFFRQLDKWCEEYEPFLRCEQAIKELPSVQPETTACTDAVSRQAVKEQMVRYGFHAPDMTITEFIEDLPHVNPQPKMGYWIKTIGESGITSAVRCSECGFEDNRYMLFRYCPKCGCRMVEPQESEESE